MPRLLAVGHVTWDKRDGREVLGGSVSYASLTATRLGWAAGALTAAGADFDPARDLPGISVFLTPSGATTRFQNVYDDDGTRHQTVSARAADVDLGVLPDDWRDPDALLLGPIAGEVPPSAAASFRAGVVGAIGQGWLRAVGPSGQVSAREWPDPARDLAGVHVLFLSEQDLPRSGPRAQDFLSFVPLVAYTRGWEGLTLFTREGPHEVPSLPRQEVDPTGAGDVFAAAFLVCYQESGDPLAAAAFGACAASCAVEGISVSSLGDRDEVLRRLALRERLIEEGEWDE